MWYIIKGAYCILGYCINILNGLARVTLVIYFLLENIVHWSAGAADTDHCHFVVLCILSEKKMVC